MIAGGLPGRWNSLDVTAVVQKEILGTCRIRLEHAGQNYDGKALIDTGNRLRDPVSGEPVNILGHPEIAECLLKEEIPQDA